MFHESPGSSQSNNLIETQPADLVNQSIPFSYLAVEVASNDGNVHQVQLYTDVTGGWLIQGKAPPTSDQLIDWQTVTGDTVSHQFSLQNQTQFLGVNDRVRYGTAMYSTKKVCSLLARNACPGTLSKRFRPMECRTRLVRMSPSGLRS